MTNNICARCALCVCVLCIIADVCAEEEHSPGPVPQNTDLIINVLIQPVWDKPKHLMVR